MRLWTVHPRYLDAKGLVALWREALLAQKVLAGATKGYRHHPQLTRFRAHPDPPAAIGEYLAGIAREAHARGFQFDTGRVARQPCRKRIAETKGQLLFEWEHLKAKLRTRAPRLVRQWQGITQPQPHPLFRIVRGGVREWEKNPEQSRVVPQTGPPLDSAA